MEPEPEENKQIVAHIQMVDQAQVGKKCEEILKKEKLFSLDSSRGLVVEPE